MSDASAASGASEKSEILPDAKWASYGYSLSARLKSVRTMRGVSQQRLADLSGLSRSQVSNLERNHNNSRRSNDPNLSTIYRLAYALRVPPVLLLPGAGEEVGEICWDSFGPQDVSALNLEILWPARPEDTRPFAL